MLFNYIAMIEIILILQTQIIYRGILIKYEHGSSKNRRKCSHLIWTFRIDSFY